MFKTFFPDSSRQTLAKYDSIIKQINSLELTMQKLTDSELREKTQVLKTRLTNGESIVAEAFALVREAAVRTLGIRHFDVQLIGGLILNSGKIAEMKTGEGKTLVAVLPTFLNALYGKGAHVVTVNDYLARRDAEYIGQIYKFLGLTVGLIQENMSSNERKINYNCDIVYVTNNELGFDYLRDNMAFTNEEMVQRSFFYCVVDEVDSILIDEARTPLIISGPSKAPTAKYLKTTALVRTLKNNVHYIVDEKNQNVTLQEDGLVFCEQALGISDLYNPSDPWIGYILNSIKAKELFKLNTHYIVNEQKEIIIVDEFTGRTMFGRRWSDGLHQAVEAKESVPVQDESQTLASITYQNLFLLYSTLSGMTGTAKTEELEFEKIYNLKVVPVPTHKPVRRKDLPDLIYKNQYIKWQAIANECVEMHKLGRPILVGTTTIEKSELLAALLNEFDVPYRLLNARPENIESESEIVAQAGCLNAVTIATNMAGRGTDIVLGGNPEFLTNSEFKLFLNNFEFVKGSLKCNVLNSPTLEKLQNFSLEELEYLKVNYTDSIRSIAENKSLSEPTIKKLKNIYNEILNDKKEISKIDGLNIKELGGLHVVGTERHESRRIDNQLRGRSGRQGDAGSSRFFLSLEDRLLRLFGGDKILTIMQNIGVSDTTPIQSPLLSQSLESAQKKVETYYFDIRKKLFEYDQAVNMQRNGVYAERARILERENLRDWVIEYGERSIYDLMLCVEDIENKELLQSSITKLQKLLGVPFSLDVTAKNSDTSGLVLPLQQQFQISYDLKEAEMEGIESGLMRELERSFLLQEIDSAWKEHLQKISSLKDSIGWRAYGQKDPLTEYKKEAYNFFVFMLTRIRHRVIYFILRSKVVLEF